MFSPLTVCLAVILCAAAVKLLDDWLDRDDDRTAGRNNWAAMLGPGATVYAALLLAMAAALSTHISLALFFASYCIGMFNDFSRRLPSRLRGWQESLLVCGFGAVILGWHVMLFSLMFIAAVQLLDDCLDLTADQRAGLKNLAVRFGPVECLLAGLLLLLAAWWLDGTLFPPVLAGTLLFYLCSLALSRVRPWI
jgi:4-hydroxybenzoate polyprenyltransferase